MGYFANGTEGEMYEARYCSRCIHYEDGACPVLVLHYLHNYEEANNPDSFLHILIPRSADSENEQCALFHHRDGKQEREEQA